MLFLKVVYKSLSSGFRVAVAVDKKYLPKNQLKIRSSFLGSTARTWKNALFLPSVRMMNPRSVGNENWLNGKT